MINDYSIIMPSGKWYSHRGGCVLRRRLRAAGVFLVDSADRRAGLPELE